MEFRTIPKARGVVYTDEEFIYVKNRLGRDESTLYLSCSTKLCPGSAKISGGLLHLLVGWHFVIIQLEINAEFGKSVVSWLNDVSYRVRFGNYLENF